jgi:pimeloyl-ACP methyl ester carboxylesterase
MRKQLLGAAAALVFTASVGAQIPVMMVHGFASSGATWSALNASLLGTKFVPYRTDLPWEQPVTTQAGVLNTFMGNNGLGQNTYLVGHSMGGLTSRQTARLRLVSGVITIGTPHNGTGIASSFGSLQSKIAMAAADQLTVHSILDGFLQRASITDPMYDIAAQGVGKINTSYALWLTASGVAYGLKYWAQASLSDLAFGSAWRNGLNASESSFPLPHKLGIMCSLGSGYSGGPLALQFSGPQADNMGTNLQTNAALAAINGLSLILNYDASSQLSIFDATIAGGALQDYGYVLGTYADWWTYTVVGGYPHDGVVPFMSQQFPTTPVLTVCTSPHTQETTNGVSAIVATLNSWNP